MSKKKKFVLTYNAKQNGPKGMGKKKKIIIIITINKRHGRGSGIK